MVVATSASGGSVETLDAMSRLPAGVRTVALTNTAGSTITTRAEAVVTLDAEPEVGGVACRPGHLRRASQGVCILDQMLGVVPMAGHDRRIGQ